ncbi:SH3 domain-containing protein [Kozakia baliensis]|uniref:SH3 domain-containing protein n=1 Tax=Kozakia baliensis TaxID=153496 RepID=UPI0009F64C38|nr:SH3 domain-containing protein [Kozakia baliensis]
MNTFRCGYGIWLAALLPLTAYGQGQSQATHHHHHHKHAHSGAADHGETTHGAGEHSVAKKASSSAAQTKARHKHRHGAHEVPEHQGAQRSAHRAAHRNAAKVAAAGATAGAAAGSAATAAPDAPPVPPPDAPPQDKGTNTGLPLPRFAAMRADKVYMRKGPGQRYPIEWVYHRRGLPVEVEREFDVWRLIEDSDGTKGWVHQATLVGQRTFVIPGLPPEGNVSKPGEAPVKSEDVIGRADARVVGHLASEDEARGRHGDVLLYNQADENSGIVAVLQPGTVGTLKLCSQGSGWCRVVVKGYTGWLPRRLFWGLLPGETIQPS